MNTFLKEEKGGTELMFCSAPWTLDKLAVINTFMPHNVFNFQWVY